MRTLIGMTGLPLPINHQPRREVAWSGTATCAGFPDDTEFPPKPLISLDKPSVRESRFQGQKSRNRALAAPDGGGHFRFVQTRKDHPPMIKNTVIALVTAAALAGVAAPAMASTSLLETSDNDFDAAYVLAQVQDKGINASAVEEWGDYVVATVTDETGKTTRIFLTPVTLDVVNL
jgi:hypothetical protein